MRASKNARQHGLSVSLACDPALSDRARQLAREISGSAEVLDERSVRVAEAQIDLVCVGVAKQALLERLNEACSRDPAAASSGGSDDKANIAPLLKQLDRVDRYERRALSRRRKAIRLYDSPDDDLIIEVQFYLAERSQNDQ
jgi:hypothetical protein